MKWWFDKGEPPTVYIVSYEDVRYGTIRLLCQALYFEPILQGAVLWLRCTNYIIVLNIHIQHD